RHTRCLSDWSSDVCSSDLVPTCFEECTHEIGPPKRGKNIDEGFIRTGGDVRFCDEHGNTLGQSVIAPNVQNVANEVGFFVELAQIGRASCRERGECWGVVG